MAAASGGVVNVATKSGTNSFHGTLYEFNRVSALAANTYNNDAQRQAAFPMVRASSGSPAMWGRFGFTRNQFGYSIGGPIVKNKLFFFSSTEWTRVRSNTTTTVDIVDPAWLALRRLPRPRGHSSTSMARSAPNFNTISKVSWGQALGRRSDPTDMRALSCHAPFALAGQYNAPGDSGAGFPQNTYSTVERVDYNLSDKTTLYGRYALYSEDDFPGYDQQQPYVGFNTGQTFFNQNVTINLTHVFTPSFVSSTKLIYNRLNQFPAAERGQWVAAGRRSSAPPCTPRALRSRLCRAPTAPMIYPGYSEFTPG